MIYCSVTNERLLTLRQKMDFVKMSEETSRRLCGSEFQCLGTIILKHLPSMKFYIWGSQLNMELEDVITRKIPKYMVHTVW